MAQMENSRDHRLISFFKRQQKSKQAVINYLSELYKFAKLCNFVEQCFAKPICVRFARCLYTAGITICERFDNDMGIREG